MLLVLFALLVGLVVFGALSSDGGPGDERTAVPGVQRTIDG